MKDDKDYVDEVVDGPFGEITVRHNPSCEVAKRIMAERESAGPAMVNSKAYRDGWETLFGQRVKAGDA